MIAGPKEIVELVKQLWNNETLNNLIETIAERKAQEIMDTHEENYNHDSLEDKASSGEGNGSTGE